MGARRPPEMFLTAQLEGRKAVQRCVESLQFDEQTSPSAAFVSNCVGPADARLSVGEQGRVKGIQEKSNAFVVESMGSLNDVRRTVPGTGHYSNVVG
jgi:hypothetical protein